MPVDLRRSDMRRPLRRRATRMLTLMLAVLAALPPLQPPALAAELPMPSGNWLRSGQATHAYSGNKLTINQTSNRAILNWQSFNIGRDGTVRFNQPGASAATLNRIFDANPSVIQGQLSANGQIYLINQSGIIFGQGAQVNVGSLIASSLDITDDLFERGLLTADGNAPAFTFNGDAGQFLSSLVRIDAGAELKSASGGRILVFAPRVENAGSISTPDGQTILAAGSKIYLAAPQDTTLRGLLVEVDSGAPAAGASVNAVINQTLGKISAERGNITLAALAVNQSGRVTATTSVNLNGSIRLLARDSVVPVAGSAAGVVVPAATRGGTLVLGEGSTTEVLPELADERAILDEQAFTASSIAIAGRSIHVQRDAKVVAPGGNIDITAQSGQVFQLPGSGAVEGVRVYFEPGSVIDVSGTRDVYVPIERNVIEVELRGTELADSPLQRNGILRGQKIRVDVRKGSPLANIEGVAAQVGRTVAERTSDGGTIVVRSEGDIVQRSGAAVDISGGSLRYRDGYINTTKLYSQGRLYDISEADPNRIYEGTADTYVKSYAKWGVTETFRAITRGEFERGYVEGKHAGSAQFTSNRLVLDGDVHAGTVSGPYQRDAGKRPLAGELVIGDRSQGDAGAPDFRLGDVWIQEGRDLLPDSFGFDSGTLPEAFAQQATLSLAALRSGQVGRLAVYSNGRITLADAMELPAGGSVNLTGRQIDVQAGIKVPAGQINLATRDNIDPDVDPARHVLKVASGVTVSSRGLWVNDSPVLNAGPATGPALIGGGSVTMSSAAGLVLGAGSLIDVSGGGRVHADGTLRAGDAGSINLRTGRVGLSPGDPQQSRLVLDGDLRGYSAGHGGALSINTTSVLIGGTAGLPSQLVLDPGFFGRGGFRGYAITGADGVTVRAGTQLHASVQSLVLDDSFSIRGSGADILSFSRVEALPLHERDAVSLTLNAGSSGFGNLLVEDGARLSVDPGGHIALLAGRQLTMHGSAIAHGGNIRLATSIPGDNDSFEPGVSLWLGSGARLDASGTYIPVPNALGLRTGEVMDGGTVTLEAGKGYLVAEAGAVVNVSGASATLDLQQGSAGSIRVRPVGVGSHAGAINLRAREGLLFDAILNGQGGSAHARGASLNAEITLTGSNPFFPSGERVLTLRETGAAVPAGLAPGDTIDMAAHNGRGFFNAAAVREGGFDSLTLKARDRIEIAGDVDLALRSKIQLDAPVISAAGSTHARLAAAYVTVGNTDIDQQILNSATGGDGKLTLSGNLVELIGRTALRGFGETTIVSDGDMRLRGVLNGANGRELVGALLTGGDVEIKARQVYATTLSAFRLAVTGNPEGTIIFERNGADTPVLSAASRLTVEAPVIRQGGVLKAPLGEIVLHAGSSVTLAEGSETSVSAEGQRIPFGHTELSGRDYAYALDSASTLIFDTPPEKRVSLAAPDVTVEQGAVLDLSGGGDLYAYEFIAGPGGSRDVLDAATSQGTFAIMPALGAGYAPYDHESYRGVQGLGVGDMVYLSGVSGLRAGYYTLLPARYALLPGAWLVTPTAGHADIVPGWTAPRIDGSQLVSGFRATLARNGSVLRDSRTSAFDVRRGTVARSQSEFLDTLANGRYAQSGARRPVDAGRLAISATNALALDGTVLSPKGGGGRGAAVDIDAPRLAIIGSGPADPGAGYLLLQASSLSALNAESLLLGGIRTSTADGAAIVTVGAEEVLVANDAGSILRAPELVIAARDRITVRTGAVVEGRGGVSGEPGGLRRGDAAQAGSGDGALLRVSGGGQAALVRSGVSRAQGVLVVENGAVIGADRSVILDATLDNRFSGTLDLGNEGALALGASRISVGDVPAGTEGLIFANSDVAGLTGLADLLLRSYSTLDLYGDATLGSADLDGLTVEAAGIGGYANAGQTAQIRARVITLGNPNGLAFTTPAGGAAGTGTLAVEGENVRLAAGGTQGFSVNGFDDVDIMASREIVVNGSGRFSTPGNLTLYGSRLTGDTGARYDIVAGGELRTAHASLPASEPPAPDLAASLSLTGKRVLHGGAIALPAGRVVLRATGTDAADDVVLGAGSTIGVAGVERKFGDASVTASAGSLTLMSAHGNVVTESGAAIDLKGIGGGDAGTLVLLASSGTVSLMGAIDASAASAADSPRQGSVALDVGSIVNFSALNATFNQAGFNESRDIRVRSGDILIAGRNPLNQRPADQVVAHNVRLAADDGDIIVGGVIDASGAKGGNIVLSANRRDAQTHGAGNVILSSGALLDASSNADPATVADANGRPFGTRGRGGSVRLSSSGAGIAGDVGIDIASGSTIDVASAGVAANGSVNLRAPRTSGDTDVLVNPIHGIVVANPAGSQPATVAVEGVRVYDGIDSIGTVPGTGLLTFDQIANDNAGFLSSANIASMSGRLASDVRLRAGVEVRTAGDLSLDSDWNLFSTSRPGGEPGVLTLRAGGDLKINGNLSDGFSSAQAAAVLQAGESWSYRLVGGADTDAADALAVLRAGDGDVVIGADKLVRTGTGSIEIAAARDIVLTNQGSVIYTAGVPSGTLANFANISIGGANAEFPSRGGNIAMRAGRDITSVTGSTQLFNNWLFRQGKTAEAINTTQFRNSAWWPRFREFQQGVGTLGGGDVRIGAGGDINNLSVSIVTNSRLPQRFGEAANPGLQVVQGGGDLDMRAGGGIGSASIYVDRGTARVRAGEEMDSSRSVVVNETARPVYSLLALGDAKIDIETAGSIAVDAIVNPTLMSQSSLNRLDFNRISFYSTYSGDSSASLRSLAGSVTLANDPAKAAAVYGSLLGTAGSGELDALVLYPGTLRAAALTGDLSVLNGFQMFPASRGNLELLAGGNVSVAYNGDLIAMSDVLPESLPSALRPATSFVSTFGALLANPTASGFLAHSDSLLHAGDASPVRIVALDGDITGPIDLENGAFLFGVYPKPAVLQAGRDIRNVWIYGQNLDSTDLTTLQAGRDVVFDTLRDASGNQRSNSGRIEVGGPGRVEVVAGRNIDLGNSSGIVTRGNLNNPYLPESGAGVLVRAGARDGDYASFVREYITQPAPGRRGYREELAAYMSVFTGDEALTAEQALVLYDGLSSAEQTEFANLVFYSELRGAGRHASRTAGGIERYAAGFDAIATLFPEARDGKPVTYQGDVNLFFSQIKTEQGGDIDIMAPGGLVNAGLANPGGLNKPASQLGIVTARGGSIRSFVKGDFLVNQSRVFTLQGGDILLWSSEGNIDAGKGAKTARATPPPQLIIRGDEVILDTSNSVAGSGIAVLLAKEGIAPGDVDLIAPRGEVNAGDAGIRAAGNINIAAVRVVGADNISVGGVATGVPASSPGSIAAGLTGVSNLAADATKSAELATRALADSAAKSNALQQAFRPSFITVEVLGIGEGG